MSDMELDRIVSFIQEHNPSYTAKDTLREYIKKHFEYKTGFVFYDNENNIVAVCRWNISKDGTIADILDLYIRKDWRFKHIIQQMLRKGLWIFPKVMFIRFERRKKYPWKDKVLIPINKILKRR